MFLKNKYLPLKSTSLSKKEANYLINKIEYWQHLMWKNYSYKFWNLSFIRWDSNKEKFDRSRQSNTGKRLDTIQDCINIQLSRGKEIVISDDDLDFLNNVYRKFRFKLIPFTLG